MIIDTVSWPLISSPTTARTAIITNIIITIWLLWIIVTVNIIRTSQYGGGTYKRKYKHTYAYIFKKQKSNLAKNTLNDYYDGDDGGQL